MGKILDFVKSAFTPSGEELVTAASDRNDSLSQSINLPMARDRMLEFFEREQLPGDVKQTLAAALNGDLHYQHLLFTAMIDSWPKLQSNIGEIARAVANSPWKVMPFAIRGDDPTPESEILAKEIEEIVWRMKPDVKRGENNLEEMISTFAMRYFIGHGVEEILWSKDKDGMWKPRATKPVPARFYGYPYDTMRHGDDNEDRLMLDTSGLTGSRNYVDFPENRFLIGINKGHIGHASVAAPLRALAPYWLAAVYGLKWFMNFTQLYGIPWRHAEVADPKDDNAVASMLAGIGSRGYLITRPKTKINLVESSKGGGNLPQRELIDLADKQCDTFILGQTLTSGTDGSGSRALGEVHADTKQARIDAVCDFVGRVLTYQFIPAIIAVNYGTGREDAPEIWVKREIVKDEKAKAERMEILTRMNLPMSEAFVYEDLGVPIPAEGDKLFQLVPVRTPEVTQKGTPPPDETKDELKAIQAAAAASDKLKTVDMLADSVLESLTGVTREWLSPVRPAFERLAALAMSKSVTDEDFMAALDKAQKEMPELFDRIKTEALQDAFEKAIGTAMIAGSVKRYEE